MQQFDQAPVKAESIEGSLATVVKGNTAPKAFSVGEYIYLKQHSSLKDGLLRVKAAIASGDALTTSNLERDLEGVVNVLNEKIPSVVNDLSSDSTTSALSAAQGKALNSNIATAFDGKNVRVVAGVIRNAGSGWEFISDSGHDKMNLASISVDSNGLLNISYGFTATKVLSFIAGCDETYAWAYDVGSSVGLSFATIYVYRKPLHIGGYIYYDGSKWDYSNCKHVKSASFDTSTGILTITHDNLQTLGYKTNEIFNCNVTGREINTQLGQLGYNTIQVKFINTDGTINKTLSTSLKAYVSRTATYSLVDAGTYVHDSNGNFWIYGVMEV